MSTPAEESAIERLCNICYHQCLWLPASAKHGVLRVTYATSSNFHNEKLPVMLFVPPQFSTRYHIAEMDKLAQDAGVRLLGFGGSQPVDLDLRVEVWLETVPVLLQKVGVKHVSLFCHSAGAVYLFNILHKYREILDPRAPNAILIAPWVPAAEAKTISSNILRMLPAGLIKAQHGAAKAIRAVSPAIQWSGSMSANLIDMSMPGLARDDDSIPLEAERYGCDVATAKEISKLTAEYIWAEETKGINDEALTCLHKTGPGTWGVCEDYTHFVRDLAKQESEARPERKLNILAFFAESDELVGTGGQKYVEHCFAQPGIANFIGFKSCVKPGTDHNSIMINHRRGPLIEAFEHIGTVLKS